MSQFTSDEFLKSFLEEANEYLQTILTSLLALEQPFAGMAKRKKGKGPVVVQSSDETASIINNLLRALHSLKGISGMVGLTQAAELCHAMESILKPVQQNQYELNAEMINQLIEAAKILDSVVQTVRDPALEMPDIHAVLARLEEFTPALASRKADIKPEPAPAVPGPGADEIAGKFPADVAAHLGEAERGRIRNARNAGNQVALVYYSPTKETTLAGRNVNQVRELLTKHTHLIKAIPLIQEGAVRFAFVVACNSIPPSAELEFLEWQEIAVEEDVRPVEEASSKPAAATALPGSTSIRVELHRMDELMQLVGDLVVTRSRISETLPRLSGVNTDLLENLEEAAAKMERQVRYLREAVMRVRLVPLSDVFSRMPLAVRDLTRSSGKSVQLVVEGGDTEIDKALADRLFDPLMHMVRNSITHGIEMPDERAAAGKPVEGTIWLSGKTEGDHVIITIRDDGAGVSVESVKAKALELGWLTEDHVLTNQDILDFICRPGFSTRESADMGSGRGMGMNAAAEIIASMGGSMSLETQPGKGTQFTLQLPLTMTIIDAFIVEAGGHQYAVPQNVVNEVIEVLPEQITLLMNHQLLPYRNGAIPLISLHQAFHLAQPSPSRLYGLVVGQKERQAAILVDRVIGLRETVVRPISDPLVDEPAISGATELGNGSVALILNCLELVNHSNLARYKPGE